MLLEQAIETLYQYLTNDSDISSSFNTIAFGKLSDTVTYPALLIDLIKADNLDFANLYGYYNTFVNFVIMVKSSVIEAIDRFDLLISKLHSEKITDNTKQLSLSLRYAQGYSQEYDRETDLWFIIATFEIRIIQWQ